MAVLGFTIPFVDTPQFFTGVSSTNLVPDVFPAAINGRPYMIDLRSGQFGRGFEPRVRDSVDQSTAPGEAAINPGGLWRRGEVSWHGGAGQKYADVAGSQDFRFWKSKGVDPWTKGQLTLLNSTKLTFPTTETNLQLVEVNGYMYMADGKILRYTTNPFASATTKTVTNATGTGTVMTYTVTAHGFAAGDTVTITGMNPAGYNVTKARIDTVATDTFTVAGAESGAFVSGGTVTHYAWKSVTNEDVSTALPNENISALATDGRQIYVGFTNSGIFMTTPGGTYATKHYATSGSYNYTQLGFAKGFMLGYHADTSNSHIHTVPYSASTSHGSAAATLRDPTFTCVGIVGGQNHIYVAGSGNDTGLVYRLGIKTDGTVDVAVVAFQHPVGEYPTSIYAYLNYIIVGTNKGVRFCSTDSSGNLVAGPLISTTADVKTFTADGNYIWFGYTNYDGSGGLGRLSVSDFTNVNLPAYSTDLMYASSASVMASITLSSKRVFTMSGVGVVAEDDSNLVTSATLETGIYRWGIPDRKFVAKVDTRALPLKGSIASAMATDGGAYTTLGTWDSENDVENTLSGSDDKVIEAQFRFTLARATATTGPTFTRWTARAYAAPFRSEVFRIPVILHNRVKVHDKDYYFDPEEELMELQQLVKNPRTVVLQLRNETISVIVEDVEWTPVDTVDWDWIWQGTATVTMRSTQE